MPENVGQPGCTDAERNRFEKIFEDGDLVDAYRELVGTEDKSGMTWRGIPSGKFGGKGMRIDHCIVSKSFCSRVESVEISGHGVDRIGFLGSDHCPLVVRVGEQGAETTENASAKKDMA